MAKIKLVSDLTCPHCGYKSSETMTTDSCLYYYECPGCGVLLKPLSGDCCVFCSYGSIACPPIQQARLGDAYKDHTDGACCQ